MFLGVVFAARVTSRLNTPLILIALGVGIIFGSDVSGLVYFDDAALTQQLANIALIFVLFNGGFGTRRDRVQRVLAPSLNLATLGVLLTAGISTLFFHFVCSWDLLRSALIGVIISSTDAAAIFSILRNSPINPRLASIIELESAANDPMAIIATTFVIQFALIGVNSPLQTVLLLIWQLLGGIALGLGIGFIGLQLFRRLKDLDRAYFFILALSIMLLAYGLADLCKASGMLATFFCGFFLGNARFPYKKTVGHLLEALSAIANVGLFVLLGLLVFPRQFSHIWLQGVIVFLVLSFIARPLAVLLASLGKKYAWKERLFLSWSGIRGAVPIVLATYPAAAGLEGSSDIFNIVFFAVVLSVLVQGTTLGKVAKLLGLQGKNQVQPRQILELTTVNDSEMELMEWYIDPDFFKGSLLLKDLELPEGCSVSMINRSEEILVPRGKTLMLPGDVLFILCSVKNAEAVETALRNTFIPKASS